MLAKVSGTFQSVPLVLYDWLMHQEAITEKLKAYSPSVKMTILSHDWRMADEKRVMVRDIIMEAGASVCWFARTRIPQSTYQADPDFFGRLTQEPLSHLIYHEVRVVRQVMHTVSLSADHPVYQWVDASWHENEAVLWARFSTFYLDQIYPFYLIEIYLPGLIRAIKSSHRVDAV